MATWVYRRGPQADRLLDGSTGPTPGSHYERYDPLNSAGSNTR